MVLPVPAAFTTFVREMMSNKKIRTTNILKWILPAIFIAYYGAVSFFAHVHVEHGVTIVHSHSFDDTTGGAAHQHNSFSEIQLFHLLSSLSVEDGAVHELQLHHYTCQIASVDEQLVYPNYERPDETLQTLRAPPAYSSFIVC